MNLTVSTKAQQYLLIEIGALSFDGEAFDIKIESEIVYVGAWDNGVKLYNISDSSKPKEVGQFNDGGQVGKTFVVDTTVFVADQ